MENRKADGLRSLSKALKTVAWIVLILGLIGGIAAMVAGQQAGQEVAQRAPAAAQETGDYRAQQALRATGTGLTATGVTGGILAIVMAVVWFLILYALGGICDGTADLLSGSRVTAAETARARSEMGSPVPGSRRDADDAGYVAPPPSRVPG